MSTLEVVQYPHPVLAYVSKPLKRVDAQLRDWISQMFSLMYAHQGVGLAANQVGLPYRMFVLNLSGEANQRDAEQVFINPVIDDRKGSVEAEEGCLSLPGLYCQVRRPETVTIRAYNLSGDEIAHTVDGLFARAVQHETDHLDGTLIIDRLSPTARLALKQELQDFEVQYSGQQSRGELPSHEAILRDVARLEQERT